MPFKIQLKNHIAEEGLSLFPSSYQVGPDVTEPDALLVRSHSLHDQDIPDSVKVIVRAGVGVNTIPVADCSARGIPVLNTPGANANAVKELALTGMLMASRRILPACDFVRSLKLDRQDELEKEVEQSKKRFKGVELSGRVLFVIGLGQIGVLLCNAAVALGMRVIGYDPHINVQNAWRLSGQVEQASQLSEGLMQADYISVHVPLLPTTRGMVNAEVFKQMKPGACLLNLSRADIVDQGALIEALEADQSFFYVSDFPSLPLKDHSQVMILPHVGASTQESESNCAKMAVQQMVRFLEEGTIVHSVNFPKCQLGRVSGCRLLLAHQNVPRMVAHFTELLASESINIVDMLNKSQDDYAYTIIDLSSKPSEALISALAKTDGLNDHRLIHLAS